jgi:hypothetical protein
MRNGCVYLPLTSELNTYAKDGGSLQNGGTFATPTTMDSLPPKSEQALLREMTIARPGRSKPANLRDQVSNMDNWKIWPTPQTRGFTNDGDLMALSNACDSFEEMSAMAYRAAHKKKAGYFPTPQANKTTESGEIVNADGTPWDGISKPHSKTTGRPITTALADAVAKFPTPVAFMHKGSSEKSGQRRDGRDRTNDRLDHFVGDKATARLSPDWTESFLMLWPRGWSSLEPLPPDAWYSMQPHDEPDDLPRVTSNCPNRAARLKAIGNGQVPACAKTAWILLLERFDQNIQK